MKPLLYPYCETLQELYSDKAIWLIEDNSSVHTKAEWIARRDRIERVGNSQNQIDGKVQQCMAGFKDKLERCIETS